MRAPATGAPEAPSVLSRMPDYLLRLALGWLVAGLVARAVAPQFSDGIWMAGLVMCGVPMLVLSMRAVLRGNMTVDLIASFAILAAILVHSPLPGLIVVIMQNGGERLEQMARGRATDAVRALERDVPRTARRVEADGHVEEIGVDQIRVGDVLQIRAGEMVPCDAVVIEGASRVSTARLTGESIPRRATPGVTLWSGMLNGDGSLTLRATATAGESQYAKLVELVRFGQSSKAPLQRLADRTAAWFTPVTLLACAITWLITGSAERVLAVLVVATPCPLILATPIAIIGGIDRAAARSIVFRTGAALEQLATITAAVFDKTGTITVGEPAVDAVIPVGTFTAEDVLRFAGAMEMRSSHALARSVVTAAKARGSHLPTATEVHESAGEGVEGIVDDRRVAVGGRTFAANRLSASESIPPANSDLCAYVVVDGALAGTIQFADKLRAEAREVLAALRAMNVRRHLLLSGDSAGHTMHVAAEAGVTEAVGELLPEEKVDRVRALLREGEAVVMVGDGVNDAPALVAATVGIAMAPKQGGLAADAAGVVLMRDDLRGVPEALEISRTTMRIARQSIFVGLGLSMAAMAVASVGLLPPLVGAIFQEVLDVAVILNALRSRSPQLLRDLRAKLLHPHSPSLTHAELPT